MLHPSVKKFLFCGLITALPVFLSYPGQGKTFLYTADIGSRIALSV
jgi:hypothetical protein